MADETIARECGTTAPGRANEYSLGTDAIANAVRGENFLRRTPIPVQIPLGNNQVLDIHDRGNQALFRAGAGSGANSARGVRPSAPVHVPLVKNCFLYVGELMPSTGTGVFIPKVQNIVHGGAEPEIDEQEGARLIGKDLYNLINS